MSVGEYHYDFDLDDADDGGGDIDPAATPHKLIRASAGSGKTHALTSQYLSLLRREAPPDAILATTFTRKAAGEILGRVMVRLLKATRGEPDAGPGSDPLMPRPEAARLLRRLADRLHRVNISTLDSFFHRLGQAFRLELDLPLEPRLIDEGSAQAAALRGEAIEATLAEAATDDAAFTALLDLLRRLDHGRAGRSVTRAIDRIVTAHAEVYRQAPDRAVWTALEVPGRTRRRRHRRRVGRLARNATPPARHGEGDAPGELAKLLGEDRSAGEGERLGKHRVVRDDEVRAGRQGRV